MEQCSAGAPGGTALSTHECINWLGVVDRATVGCQVCQDPDGGGFCGSFVPLEEGPSHPRLQLATRTHDTCGWPRTKPGMHTDYGYMDRYVKMFSRCTQNSARAHSAISSGCIACLRGIVSVSKSLFGQMQANGSACMIAFAQCISAGMSAGTGRSSGQARASTASTGRWRCLQRFSYMLGLGVITAADGGCGRGQEWTSKIQGIWCRFGSDERYGERSSECSAGPCAAGPAGQAS